MSANFNPDTKEVTKLSPFRGWVYERFPFIQEDFDSLTSYELWCKVVEYINKMAESINTNADNNNALVKAYDDLQKYVNAYFDDLDVQTEIDNKLDAMVLDGTMAEIINEKIFTELNNEIDTINNTTIPAIESSISDLSDTVDSLITPDDYVLFLGDSYCAGSGNDGVGWSHKLANLLGLDSDHYYICAERGGGFLRAGVNNFTFIEAIQDYIDSIPDTTKITKIFFMFGITNYGYTLAQLLPAYTDYITYLKTHFPNANKNIYVGFISGDIRKSSHSQMVRAELYTYLLDMCANSRFYGIDVNYLSGLENIMKNPTYFSSDRIHPNDTGYDMIATAILNAYKNNFKAHYSYKESISILDAGNITFNVEVDGDVTTISWLGQSIDFNTNKSSSNTSLALTSQYECTSMYTDDSVSIYKNILGYPLLLGFYYNGSWKNIPSSLIIGGDGVLSLKLCNDSNTDVTGISRIYLYAGNLVIGTKQLFIS